MGENVDHRCAGPRLGKPNWSRIDPRNNGKDRPDQAKDASCSGSTKELRRSEAKADGVRGWGQSYAQGLTLKGVVRFGKRGKLNPRYVGTFNVLCKSGEVAQNWKLPQEFLSSSSLWMSLLNNGWVRSNDFERSCDTIAQVNLNPRLFISIGKDYEAVYFNREGLRATQGSVNEFDDASVHNEAIIPQQNETVNLIIIILSVFITQSKVSLFKERMSMGLGYEDGILGSQTMILNIWKGVALTLKTKGGLELLSFDDLYYKLKTLEIVSCLFFIYLHCFPSNSKTGSHRSGNVIEDVLQSFVADFLLEHEQQLADEDFKTDRKIRSGGDGLLNGKMALFNMKKVRCYNVSQRGHFARDYQGRKVGNDKQRYSSFKIQEIGKKEEDSKALITVDTLVDWTEHDGQSDGVITPKEFEEGAAKIYNLITGACYQRKAYDKFFRGQHKWLCSSDSSGKNIQSPSKLFLPPVHQIPVYPHLRVKLEINSTGSKWCLRPVSTVRQRLPATFYCRLFLENIIEKDYLGVPRTIVDPQQTSLDNLFQKILIPDAEDEGILDSGCSRSHDWGTMERMDDFQEFQGGKVTFGGGEGWGYCANGQSKNFHTDFENALLCKQHKAFYKAITAMSSISEPLQLLHMDLFGPTSIRSIDHKYYCLFDKKGKAIDVDNGTEFNSCSYYFELCGSKMDKVRDYCNARTSKQNRVAEWKYRTLMRKLETIILEAKPLDTSGDEVDDSPLDSAEEIFQEELARLISSEEDFSIDKGQTKLGLWYLRESHFVIKAYSDSDYAGANKDRKSTTGGCQFLGRRLFYGKLKEEPIVATFFH
ncbi:ribonuclease H-like domain-containing protein [Tanacetum coccineum]